MTELHRMLRAENRPIVEKTTGHFMAMTAEQKREFVTAICHIYGNRPVMIFDPTAGEARR